MNRYLEDKAKARRDLEEWRRYLAEGINQGNRKGVRKVRKDELGGVVRMPNDPIPLVRWASAVH